MADRFIGPGWWLAPDGKWYPPHDHASYRSQDQARDGSVAGSGPSSPADGPPGPPRPPVARPPRPDHAQPWPGMWDLPGWTEQPACEALGLVRRWQDARGDAVVLAEIPEAPHPMCEDDDALWEWASRARTTDEVLVEATSVANGAAVRLATETAPTEAFGFIGQLWFRRKDAAWESPTGGEWMSWTVTCTDRGVTPIQRSHISSALVDLGLIVPDERAGPRPFAGRRLRPGEKRFLRYRPDDPIWDDRYLDHPLTRTRRLLAYLTPTT